MSSPDTYPLATYQELQTQTLMPVFEIMKLPPSIDVEGMVGEDVEGMVYSQLPTPASRRWGSSEKKPRPAWGSARNGNGNSSSRQQRTSRYPAREHCSAIPTAVVPKSAKSEKLRSAKKLRSIPSARKSSPASSVQSYNNPASKSSHANSATAPLSPRESHNLIEKQYRTRLNGLLSTLLEALPVSVVRDGELDGDGEKKKVSKSKVLVLARQHIIESEKGNRRLEDANRRLVRELGRLEDAWRPSGGAVL